MCLCFYKKKMKREICFLLGCNVLFLKCFHLVLVATCTFLPDDDANLMAHFMSVIRLYSLFSLLLLVVTTNNILYFLFYFRKYRESCLSNSAPQ